ncbi:MAG TPA: AAA family ATPase [Kiloniellales bacterium]
MYEGFYGLGEKPFALTPDPSFIYLSERHAAALTALEYGFATQAAIVLITGEVGCGKTTLVRHLANGLDGLDNVGFVSNATSSLTSLPRWICRAFGLPAPAGADASELYEAFADFVADKAQAGGRVVLIVDEAQNLSREALEQLRTLSNLNLAKEPALQTVLVGQVELEAQLAHRELRQLVQRISIHYRLDRLRLGETIGYINHRLRVAGARVPIFDDYASAAVHHLAAGIPRLVNTLCDRALVHGYAEDLPAIGIGTVLEVRDEIKRSGFNLLAAGQRA